MDLNSLYDAVCPPILTSFLEKVLEASLHLMVTTAPLYIFFKTLFKGKNFAVEWERGKFDFDHYFAFLTNFLKG